MTLLSCSADGLFHVLMYVVGGGSLRLLWRSRREFGRPQAGRLLMANALTRLCPRYSTPECAHPSKRLCIILRVCADGVCETEMEQMNSMGVRDG